MALPTESVQTVMNWTPPQHLPRSASWVAGVLAGQGEAVPVLREGHLWGVPAGSAEIYVVVHREGRALAILGAGPRMISPRPLSPWSEDQHGPWSGAIDDPSGEVPCLDVGKLYMALGLH